MIGYNQPIFVNVNIKSETNIYEYYFSEVLNCDNQIYYISQNPNLIQKFLDFFENETINKTFIKVKDTIDKLWSYFFIHRIHLFEDVGLPEIRGFKIEIDSTGRAYIDFSEHETKIDTYKWVVFPFKY